MNQTLTPTQVTKKPSGWWDVLDSDGNQWGVPPADKFTQTPNDGLAKELEASLGKPIELAVWIKDDQSSRIITGKPKPRGQGGGFKGMSSEDRAAERASIEAQGAAKIAVAILDAVPDHSFSPTRSREWVVESIPIIAQAIRAAASGGQEPSAGPRLRHAAADEQSSPPEPSAAPSPSSQSRAEPGAASSSGDTDGSQGAPPPEDTPHSFKFTSGDWKGWEAWEVAQRDPDWLQANLHRLSAENRAIAERLLK
jgi:hypothetical protein